MAVKTVPPTDGEPMLLGLYGGVTPRGIGEGVAEEEAEKGWCSPPACESEERTAPTPPPFVEAESSCCARWSLAKRTAFADDGRLTLPNGCCCCWCPPSLVPPIVPIITDADEGESAVAEDADPTATAPPTSTASPPPFIALPTVDDAATKRLCRRVLTTSFRFPSAEKKTNKGCCVASSDVVAGMASDEEFWGFSLFTFCCCCPRLRRRAD